MRKYFGWQYKDRVVWGERGLVTLEWMLIVGAVAGLAALSALAVNQTLDNSRELPARGDILIVEAEIAAAQLADAATQSMIDDPKAYLDLNINSDFESRCVSMSTSNRFRDVLVGSPRWFPPQTPTPNPTATATAVPTVTATALQTSTATATAQPTPTVLTVIPARCILMRR